MDLRRAATPHPLRSAPSPELEELGRFRGRRLLVLGNAHRAAMRSHYSEAAAGLGVHTVLLADPGDDAPPGLFGEIHRIELRDLEAVLRLVDRLHAADPFDGVATFVEPHVELKAWVAERLRLAGISPGGAVRCRSKLAMRRALEQAGVPVPGWAPVATVDELAAGLGAVGFPCVLKPATCWASFGVIKLEGGEDFAAAFERAAAFVRTRTGEGSEFLVEEFVPGPEFSCEGVVDRLGIQVAGVTEKLVTPEPFFEEKQHVHPALLQEHVRSQVVDTARRAVEALGITVGAFHAEIRLSPEGPRVIEVANRLGGDGIPVLVKLASGRDLAASDIAAALGGSLPLTATRSRFAGIRFFFPPRQGRLRRVELALDLRRLPGIANFTLFAEPGEEILLPPAAYGTRPGWVIAVARDRERLVETLETIDRNVVWELE